MATLDQQLLAVYDEFNRKQKIKTHLQHLHLVIAQKEQEQEALALILDEEQADLVRIIRLDSFTDMGVVSSMECFLVFFRRD